MRFGQDIELSEVPEGLLVRQGTNSYMARRWRLSDNTIELVSECMVAGLDRMIRVAHPRENARIPNRRGVVYLAFSPTTVCQWAIAVDALNLEGSDFRFAAFNGKLQAQFDQHSVPYRFEKRNRTAKHMEVPREHVISTIRLMPSLNLDVLAMNRRSAPVAGFATEYDIQTALLADLGQTPLSEFGEVLTDEYPIDGGRYSRRIDLLLRNEATGALTVVELKRAEANVEAVHHVVAYRNTLTRDDRFALAEVHAALIAERIPTEVRQLAAINGVAAFEIAYPLCVERVA